MTAAASAPSTLAGTPLRKRGSKVAGARAWIPLRISGCRPPLPGTGRSWAVLRAVVVRLEDLHLADTHAGIVETAAQLLGEKPRQLLGGGVPAALGERVDLVDISVVGAACGLDGGGLERGEIQHLAGRVQLARLGVHDHPVVVPVQRLAAGLAQPHLVGGAEPELLADPVPRHGGILAGRSSAGRWRLRSVVDLPEEVPADEDLLALHLEEAAAGEVVQRAGHRLARSADHAGDLLLRGALADEQPAVRRL